MLQIHLRSSEGLHDAELPRWIAAGRNPDLVHAVESVNHGREDSSVFYIPGLPGCRRNFEYVRRQRERFEAGRTPPDFPSNDSECGFVGRGGVLDLSELGREMMGFDEASTSTTTGYR